MAKFSKLTKGSMTINGAGAGSDVVIDEISNTISDSNTTLITSDAVYTELQRIGYLPYGDPVELMISGTLENQQYCDNPPDLRGLTFYVKYENSYHKYVPVTDSHITAGNWDNTEGYLTTTITYTEDGVGVSNTISAYCVPEAFVIKANDFNPNGVKKSEMSQQLVNSFPSNNHDYAVECNIMGKSLDYMRKCTTSAPTTLTAGSSITHKAPSFPYIWLIEKINEQNYTFELSKLYGVTDVEINGIVTGYRYEWTSNYRGSYGIAACWYQNHSPSYMINANGREMNSMVYLQFWTNENDWKIEGFTFEMQNSNFLRIGLGGVSGNKDGAQETVTSGVDISYNGNITLTLTYPYGTVNSAGLWGINSSTDNHPISMTDVFAQYDDIIPSPVVNLTLSGTDVAIHVSPEYSNWYARDYSGNQYIHPLYNFRSSHGHGSIDKFKSGTSLTYTDKDGNAYSISQIQEITWGSDSAIVTYKDSSLVEHTITIGNDNWYRNYNLTIVANPTRTDGTTKY